MTVSQLIEELKKYPQDMPVATYYDIDWKSKDEPNSINIEICTCVNSNYPYDIPDFEFVSLQ